MRMTGLRILGVAYTSGAMALLLSHILPRVTRRAWCAKTQRGVPRQEVCQDEETGDGGATQHHRVHSGRAEHRGPDRGPGGQWREAADRRVARRHVYGALLRRGW